MAPARVMVFIDYQNAYRSARRAFFNEWDPGFHGQVQPRRLGLILKGVDDDDRELVGVRVYRGLPIEKHDVAGAAAADRQVGLWKQQELVEPVTRSLNYRDAENPREKGIDVALAIDFVMFAHRDAYDIGVLFSEDTDLVPALEAVADLRGPDACETGCWAAEGKQPRPLLLPHQRLGKVHLLSRREFDMAQDNTDYNLKRRRR